MANTTVTWVRYSWQLQGKTFGACVPTGYTLRLADRTRWRVIARLQSPLTVPIRSGHP